LIILTCQSSSDSSSSRTLEVQFTLSHEDDEPGLASAHWPSLENVALHVGDTQFGSDATVEDLASILEPLPRLRNLAILGFADAEKLIRWLSSSPLLPRLQTLSLPGTLESAADAAALGAMNPFRHVRVDAGPLLPSAPPGSSGDVHAARYDMKEWRRRF
jgi:hypothetical protein